MNAAESLFLDTNVLVYAHDRNEPVKGPCAHSLLTRVLAAGRPVLSVQVLSEFYWAATRKIAAPLGHDEATAEIQRFHSLAQVVPLTWDIVEKTLRAIAAHGLPLWYAQIFAAAKLHGATCVLSEDFQDGRTIEGVSFLNPFKAGFDIAALLGP